MALIDKLGGFQDPETGDKFSVNAFHASLVELSNGEVTPAQIKSYFGMDAEDQADLDWLIDKYNAQPTAEAKSKFVELMRSLFVLAESGVPGYTTSGDLVARINRI